MNELKSYYIYTGKGLPSKEFLAVCIPLDLTVTSSLKFTDEKKWALKCIEEGFKLVWDLEIGALKECDEMHFLTLNLALEHFVKEILSVFMQETLGAILYKGKMTFDLNVLKMLHAALPEDLTTFLLLETHLPQDLRTMLSLEHFTLALTSQNMPYGLPTMGWGHCHSAIGSFTEKPLPLLCPKKMTEALCLPHDPCEINWEDLPPCRIISEEALTMSWDGIDKIFVPYEKLSLQGKRKIAGFKAAGGEVVNL